MVIRLMQQLSKQPGFSTSQRSRSGRIADFTARCASAQACLPCRLPRRLGLLRMFTVSLTIVALSKCAIANEVVSWGRQVLPPPDQLRALREIDAGDEFNLGLRVDGRVIAWGSNNYRQAEVPEDLEDVVAIAAGARHALALRRDGTVVAWGNNRDKQTTVPEGLSNVTAVRAGRAHSLALRRDGSIIAWGGNRDGQTTIPAGIGPATAIAAGDDHSLALLATGKVVAWGSNSDGQISVPEDLSGVIAIAAGGSHSLALRKDGTLVAWGNNAFAQSAVPPIPGAIAAIDAGRDHTMVLLQNGNLLAWGRNHYGQITIPDNLPPLRRIAAGGNHSLAGLQDGSFVAWGRNNSGQALNLDDLSTVIAISSWDGHTIALRENGTVFWWGWEGLFGSGVAPDPTRLRNIVAVAAGRAHGLALRADGTVVAWGDDLYGQSTPPPGLEKVAAIAAGEFHSLAVREDGSIVAWGSNFYDQISVPRGLNEVIAVAGGQDHSLALTLDGLVYAWGDDFHGQRRVPASLESVVEIAAGALHNVALRSNGTLEAWGSDLFGQCSPPAGLSDVVAVAASRSHSVAVRENRGLIAWGGNHYGQSTIPENLNRVVDVTAGSGRTTVVTGSYRPPEIVSELESRVVAAGEDVFIRPLIIGTPPMTFQWMRDGQPLEDAVGAALSLENVGAADSGSYSLVIANRAGNSTSRSFFIQVDDPSVELELRPEVAVLGGSAALTAWVRGTGPFTYQWAKDGEPLPQATEMTLAIENVHEDDTGQYTVEVSNEHGTTRSEPVQLLVEARIERQPPPVVNARIGERTVISLQARGSPPLEIQWLREGVPMEDATGPELVLPNIAVRDGGIYSAVVSNPAGRIRSEPVAVRIIPHILLQPEPQIFSSFGGTAVFEVRAIGSLPLSYHWIKDGRPLTTTPEPRLVVENVQAEDSGVYQVIVRNQAGQVESEPANLTVPPAIAMHPQSQTVDAGEAVTFSVRALGTEPFSFQWLKDGEPISGAESPSLRLESVNGIDGARYSVVVTNEVGAATSEAATLSIAPVIVRHPEAADIPVGGNIVLTVEAEGGQPLYYQWAKNGNYIPEAEDPILRIDNAAESDTGIYAVIVSNAAGIQVSESVRVRVE